MPPPMELPIPPPMELPMPPPMELPMPPMELPMPPPTELPIPPPTELPIPPPTELPMPPPMELPMPPPTELPAGLFMPMLFMPPWPPMELPMPPPLFIPLFVMPPMLLILLLLEFPLPPNIMELRLLALLLFTPALGVTPAPAPPKSAKGSIGAEVDLCGWEEPKESDANTSTGAAVAGTSWVMGAGGSAAPNMESKSVPAAVLGFGELNASNPPSLPPVLNKSFVFTDIDAEPPVAAGMGSSDISSRLTAGAAVTGAGAGLLGWPCTPPEPATRRTGTAFGWARGTGLVAPGLGDEALDPEGLDISSTTLEGSKGVWARNLPCS